MVKPSRYKRAPLPTRSGAQVNEAGRISSLPAHRHCGGAAKHCLGTLDAAAGVCWPPVCGKHTVLGCTACSFYRATCVTSPFLPWLQDLAVLASGAPAGGGGQAGTRQGRARHGRAAAPAAQEVGAPNAAPQPPDAAGVLGAEGAAAPPPADKENGATQTACPGAAIGSCHLQVPRARVTCKTLCRARVTCKTVCCAWSTSHRSLAGFDGCLIRSVCLRSSL